MPAVLALGVMFAVFAMGAQVVAWLDGLARARRPKPKSEAPAAARAEASRPAMAGFRVAPAEAMLDEIAAILARLGDAEVIAAADRFITAARRLIGAAGVHASARRASRRHLGVLLEGMRDAARALADGWRGSEHGAARAEFLAFLAEMTRAYAALARDLDRAAHDAMRVEIEVAREHLNLGRARRNP